MQNTQSNVSILNAWFKLEKTLIDAQVPENELVQQFQGHLHYHSLQEWFELQYQRPQSLRPSTAIKMKRPIEYQDKTATIQQSKESECFDNIDIEKEEQEGEISEEELNQSTVIHTLDTDQIIDLYHSKCRDRELEYQPQHAVLLIEKFKKLCLDEQFI